MQRYIEPRIMHPVRFYIVNGITLYRLMAAPWLLWLAYYEPGIFKWMLLLSYLTDLFDGMISRKWKVNSMLGAKLDSIADDLTIIVSLTALSIIKPQFFWEQANLMGCLLILFFVQYILSIGRYGRMSSFHTYAAKTAAFLQGSFFILCFFMPQPLAWLFYLAALVTALELIEEIAIVLMMPGWQTDVKGIYWVLRRQNKQDKNTGTYQ